MQRQGRNEISFHIYQTEERKESIWTLACVKEDVEQWELSSTSGGGVKNVHYSLEHCLELPRNLSVHLL